MAPNANNYCDEHKWCSDAIKELRAVDTQQWDKITSNKEEIEKRINTILSRLNGILISVAVACILLVLDLLKSHL